MPLANAPIAKFNRGKIDSRALARVDIERIAISAETQTNWVPRSLGSMTLRPGFEHIVGTDDDLKTRYLPFIKSSDDTALIELAANTFRVLVDEEVVFRNIVNTIIANGTFDSDLTSWTDADESGATSAWETGGYMALTGTRFNAAIRRQEVHVNSIGINAGMMRYQGGKVLFDRKLGSIGPGDVYSGGRSVGSDLHVQHGIRIVIKRGLVELKLGETVGGSEIVQTTLGTGTHSFAFTPTNNLHIEFASRAEAKVLVDSVIIEGLDHPSMEIATDWTEADLPNVRYAQSADIVYVAAKGNKQYQIKRRGIRSWSIVEYLPEDGPFQNQNTTTTTITSSGLSGDVTLTASRSIWTKNHIGALFRMKSVGQNVSATITGEGQWTDGIRVVGVDNSRKFNITLSDLSGTSTTATLQRSIDDETSWTDVTTYTTNQSSVSYDDSLDNTIAFYRLGVDTGDYSSGTITASLDYSGGGISGIVRITDFTSETSVGAAVLEGHRLGSTASTEQWWEGIWSSHNGYPTAVAFYEGRLWWGGQDRIIASVSDGFASFDDETEGDSAPISRTLGSGPSENINWILPLQRLIIGHAGAEVSARSSFLDEPLTPTAFNLKDASTQGSAAIDAVKVDNRGLFVQAAGFRMYELTYAAADADYAATDMSILVPDIGSPGFVHIAVQRQPDTRIHCVRSDGTVAILLYLPAEDVRAWVDVETGDADGVNGVIEDVVVLPGTEEDRVYYVVRREINGVTKRFLEKWAKESECIGGTLNKQADSFIEYSQTASATITGLSHLEGEDVIVWDNGICLADADDKVATFTVINGEITVTNDGAAYLATVGIVGLPYTSDFLSGLLPYAAGMGSELGQRQQISDIAFLLDNVHHKGLKFGKNTDATLSELPQTIDGAVVVTDTIHPSLTLDKMTFPGGSEVDTRFYLKGEAPRPVTVKAAVLGIITRDNPP